MRDNIVKLILFVFLGCTTAYAQTTTTEGSTAPATSTVVMATDSRDTRQQLREVLERLPPEVAKVLKLDPTLWTNENYLAHYPALAAFVAAHPEVTHSPAFYLEGVWIANDPSPEPPAVRLWRDTMEGFAIFAVMLGIVSGLIWLIKTLVEQRRWSRLSKIQAEVHNKLLDRFGSNEELMAYIQTPPGRRFLESAPIPLEQGPRFVSAPLNRILWSVQAGLVIIALGLGLQFVSSSAQKEVAELTSGMGALAIAIGVGFVAAAGASFILSRKLGLWQPAAGKEDAA